MHHNYYTCIDGVLYKSWWIRRIINADTCKTKKMTKSVYKTQKVYAKLYMKILTKNIEIKISWQKGHSFSAHIFRKLALRRFMHYTEYLKLKKNFSYIQSNVWFVLNDLDNLQRRDIFSPQVSPSAHVSSTRVCFEG